MNKTKMNERLTRPLVMMVLSTCVFGTAFASDFYTIIGPDGRPLVIQKQGDKKDDKKNEIKSTPQKNLTINTAERKEAVENSSVDYAKNMDTNLNQLNSKVPDVFAIEKAIEKKDQYNPQSASQTVQSESLSTSEKISNPALTFGNTAVKSTQHSNADTEIKLSNEIKTQIKKIDGVDYIDSEYLEDHEFNVEGRKRFYIVPDSTGSGLARLDTIERKKGISKSVLSSFIKPIEAEKKLPVALSSTYMRIEKADLVQSLGQACFSGKKVKKAKRLRATDSEANLWPVAPLKENFPYEIVELGLTVDQIQIQSFAASLKKPTYYWPLVVFLDASGCVLEGTTGFKNQNATSNVTHYSSIEGVIKKPIQAKYLLLTPLAESLDVPDLKLNHSGQIKLKVLR